MLSAPTMQAHISDGASQIQGDFTAESARALSNQLKYGALPLTFELNDSSFEGPTLAGNAAGGGPRSGGLLGLLLTIVYLFLYYRGLGIAGRRIDAGRDRALTYVLVLLLGAGVGFTLTLARHGRLHHRHRNLGRLVHRLLRADSRRGARRQVAPHRGGGRLGPSPNRTKLAADTVSILAALLICTSSRSASCSGFAFALGLTTLIDLLVIFVFTKPVMTLLARTKFFGRRSRCSGLDARHLGISGRDVSEIVGSAPKTARSGGGRSDGSR